MQSNATGQDFWDSGDTFQMYICVSYLTAVFSLIKFCLKMVCIFYMLYTCSGISLKSTAILVRIRNPIYWWNLVLRLWECSVFSPSLQWLHNSAGIYSAVPLWCGQFSHKYPQKTPIVRPLGWGMGCHMWIQHLLDIPQNMPQFLQLFNILHYWTALKRHPIVLSSILGICAWQKFST